MEYPSHPWIIFVGLVGQSKQKIQVQMHNSLVKGCSIMKMFTKNRKRGDCVEYTTQGSHSKQCHRDIWKCRRENEEKHVILKMMI